MIAEITDIINRQIGCCLPVGSKLYGLTQLIQRPVVGSDQVQTLPAMVDRFGEGTYVGLDDTYPLQLYHRMLTLAISYPAASGYGDSQADTLNTFGMLMVVYMQQRRVDLALDELLLTLQELIQFQQPIAPYKMITVRATGTQLVSSTVFGQEYQNTGDRIPPGAFLFSISYQVEVRYRKGCILDDCKLIPVCEPKTLKQMVV